MDQERMTWRLDSFLKHILGYPKSAIKSLSTVEVYCNLEGLKALSGRLIPAEIMAQAQRSDLVIVEGN
jgi:hypothetical protein